MIERLVTVAVAPIWLASTAGFAFFSGVGYLTLATAGQLGPRPEKSWTDKLPSECWVN